MQTENSNSISDNSRIAKNTLFLYVRMLLIMGVSLYTSRVVLNTLGVDDYGIYNVVGGVVAMSSFLNGMMIGATQRFLNVAIAKGNKEYTSNVFSTSLEIHVIICIIVLLLAETVGLWFLNAKLNIPPSRMVAANCVYQFSMLSSLVVIMSVPYNAAIIAHEKMSAFAYISVVEVILKLVIVYLLLLISFDKLIVYAFLLLVIQLLVRWLYTKYSKKHFEECVFHAVYDKSIFKEMTCFASWSFLGVVSGMGYTQGISIILNLFFGVTINAARAVTSQVQSAILGFITNFQVAVNPQLVKSYASDNFDRMKELIYSSSRFSFYLMLLLALPIILDINPILEIWLKIVPDHTANFVRLVLIIMLFETLTNPIIVSVNATGRIKKCQIIVGSLMLLILPIAYVVLKLGGNPEMVYIVQFTMLFGAQVARILILKPMINLSLKEYFQKVLVNIVFVLLIATILPVTMYSILSTNYLSAINVFITSILSTCLTVYFVGLDKNERMKLKIYLTKFKHKFKNEH